MNKTKAYDSPYKMPRVWQYGYGESVLDINFDKDLRTILAEKDKTVADYVKSLERFMQEAAQGKLDFLEDILDQDKKVIGKRYSVPRAFQQDVLAAAEYRIGRWTATTEADSLSSVTLKENIDAYTDQTIKLYDAESKGAFSKLAKALGVKVKKTRLGKDTGNAYDAYDLKVPNKWMPEGYDVDSSVSSYLTAYEKESKEKSEKEESLDEKQEKSSFFNKSLIYLAGIGETVRRIFGVVSKLYDNALKVSYTAQAANVNPDKLRQLEYALQGFGFDKGVAGSVLGLISGGMMNPLQLNENLVDTLAPLMGKTTADMVNEMLLGGGDTLSALTMIMEGARNKVAAGGMTGTMDAGKAFSEVYAQLMTAGGGLEKMFQAYMKAVDKAQSQGIDKFAFTDFLNLFPATGTGISADAALQKFFLGTKAKSAAENTVYGSTYNPAKTYRNFRWGGNPYENELDFYGALTKHGFNVGEGADIFSFEPQVKELMKSRLPKDVQDELQRILDTFTDMRARRWQTDAPYWGTDGFKIPFDEVSTDAFIGPAVERASQGFSGFLNSGGVNYFDYTTNNTSTPGTQELGRAQVDMNLRINGKEVGTYPIEIGPENYIISGDITGV